MLEQLVLFCVKKLVLLDHSNNFGTVGVKMDGSAFEKKSVFSDAGTVIVSIAKTASRKIRAFICSVKLFLSKLLFICVNQPYDLALNTVVMSGLVLLAATWKCYIIYINRYLRRSVQH